MGCPYGFVVDEKGKYSCPAGIFFTGTVCYPYLANTFKNVTSLDQRCLSCTTLPLGGYAVSPGGCNSTTCCGCPETLAPDANGECVCAPGYAYDSGVTRSRQKCARNLYSDTYSSEGCKKCTDLLGPYAITSDIGSKNASDCACPIGFILEFNTTANPSPAQYCVCPAGYYFVAATATTPVYCQQCPASSFSNNSNLDTGCSSCVDVYGGYATSAAGSTDISNCTCLPSFVLYQGQYRFYYSQVTTCGVFNSPLRAVDVLKSL
jgi:hypothetical protein